MLSDTECQAYGERLIAERTEKKRAKWRAGRKQWYAANPESVRRESADWAAKNPERKAEKQKLWKSTNRQQVRENHTKWRRRNADHVRFKEVERRYGLTKEQWDELRLANNGKCAVPTCDREGQCVDHCHETGRVRGLLCSKCNTGIGMFGDCAKKIQGAIEYLNKFSCERTD